MNTEHELAALKRMVERRDRDRAAVDRQDWKIAERCARLKDAGASLKDIAKGIGWSVERVKAYIETWRHYGSESATSKFSECKCQITRSIVVVPAQTPSDMAMTVLRNPEALRIVLAQASFDDNDDATLEFDDEVDGDEVDEQEGEEGSVRSSEVPSATEEEITEQQARETLRRSLLKGQEADTRVRRRLANWTEQAAQMIVDMGDAIDLQDPASAEKAREDYPEMWLTVVRTMNRAAPIRDDRERRRRERERELQQH